MFMQTDRHDRQIEAGIAAPSASRRTVCRRANTAVLVAALACRSAVSVAPNRRPVGEPYPP
jgi:hypothetical protein